MWPPSSDRLKRRPRRRRRSGRQAGADRGGVSHAVERGGPGGRGPPVPRATSRGLEPRSASAKPRRRRARPGRSIKGRHRAGLSRPTKRSSRRSGSRPPGASAKRHWQRAALAILPSEQARCARRSDAMQKINLAKQKLAWPLLVRRSECARRRHRRLGRQVRHLRRRRTPRRRGLRAFVSPINYPGG